MIEPKQSSRIRSIALLVLRAVLAVILLVLLFRFVSLSEVTRVLLAGRIEYLVAGLALVAVNIGLQILKWRYFVRLVNPASTNLENAASLLFGITLGSLTPGQVGEFGGRALRHNSVSAGTIMGLTLVDKLQMLCVMGIAGVTSLVSYLSLTMAARAIISLLSSIAFVLIFFRPQIIQKLLAYLPLRVREKPWMKDFLSAVTFFRRRALLISFAFSVGLYCVVFLQMFLLLNAFSPVGPADAFLGFAAMMFLKALLPISLGDLGIREAGSVYFYALRGIPHATALNASLLLFVINIFLPSIVGLIFMPKISTK